MVLFHIGTFLYVKNHIKHVDQKCQRCGKIFKSSLVLVSQVSKDHTSNVQEDKVEPKDHINDNISEVKLTVSVKEQSEKKLFIL